MFKDMRLTITHHTPGVFCDVCLKESRELVAMDSDQTAKDMCYACAIHDMEQEVARAKDKLNRAKAYLKLLETTAYRNTPMGPNNAWHCGCLIDYKRDSNEPRCLNCGTEAGGGQ